MNDGTTADAFRETAFTPLWLGLWFGLLTGLLEAGHFRLLIALEELPLFSVTATYPLAAPLLNAALFGAAGALFSAARLFRREAVSLRFAALLFAFFAGWVVVMHLSTHWLPLHSLAEVLLSVGLAVQVSRWIAEHPERMFGLVRRTFPVLLAGVVALGVDHYSPPEADRSAAVGSETDVALPSREAPNVILIVLDTVRAKSLSLYGYERETTPNLEQLAREGVTFERAHSPAPWTLPSHASMFTGRYPHELDADWCVPLGSGPRTLAEELCRRGYRTAGFVGNIYYCGRHTGLDRGFGHYDGASLFSADVLRNGRLGKRLSRSKILKRLFGWYHWPERKDASQVNAEFLAWLARRPDERPYFAFLNYFDAHDPYVAGLTEGKDPSCCYLGWFRNDYTEKEFAQLRSAYEDCIETLDAEIGRLFDLLRRQGELDNTLLIITSDHGEQLGEHGLTGHNNSLYRPVTHVPLVVVYPPRIPAGTRAQELVSLRDLPATVLDVAFPGSPAGFPGTSLAGHWRSGLSAGDAEPRPVFTEVSRGLNVPDWYPNARSALRSVWLDNLQYIRTLESGAEEFYDVEADPEETTNLVDDPESAPLLERYRGLLEGRE